MNAIVVTVRGLPAPQGSHRHVGHGRMVESSKAVGPWREAVRAETQLVMAGRPPLEGPVKVRMVFYLPRPKGHMSARGGLRPSAPGWPAGRPDLDKACRAVADALTAGGAWRDDSQMCVLVAEKQYADDYPPGALITVEGLP
jgi:crossover junction endodeoxyribonuclease RusA